MMTARSGRIGFRRLSEVDVESLVRLLNDPVVRRHMPLSTKDFDADDCRRWVAGKEQQWIDNGFGPWAFFVDGGFAGWGGFQLEEGEADLGLVLFPAFWGWGRDIFLALVEKGFAEMGFASMTVLLPPSRTRTRALLRSGFAPEAEIVLQGEKFLRFRLGRSAWQAAASRMDRQGRADG